MKKTYVLMILDGFGLRENEKHNAVAMAHTPTLDALMRECPFEKGYASGLAVGLPDGQMGNSEVGHLNIGAGRIVYQDLTKITKAIEDGDFFSNSVLLSAMENCKRNGSSLHLFGLLSDGGVHSHNTHLYALLKMAKENGIEDVFVHCFLDGRDTPPSSAAGYMKELVSNMESIGTGQVGIISGRYYAMDRDNRWERVKKAYDALTLGTGEDGGTCPVKAVEASYENGITDEFMLPTVMKVKGKRAPVVCDKDSVIFFNFRPDRARQLTRAFCDPEFCGFERDKLHNLTYVCFTDYDETIPEKTVAFPKDEINNTFGEYLSSLNMKQVRIAETEKYAHVTFFFNGGKEEPNAGEERILVPSPKVATYDLKPEMSAYAVSEKLNEAIRCGEYDVVIVNFANPDMVGHTGVEEAAIKAVETVDACVKSAAQAVLENGGSMFICADHGNAEMMAEEENEAEPFTAHTTSPVPFIIVNGPKDCRLKKDGRLCDIVPTMLELMGIEKPVEMTGESLLVRN